jgi:membrane protein
MGLMLKQVFSILKDAGFYWWRNRAGPLAAGLSYHMMASLGPLVVILLSMTGAFFDQEAVDLVFLSQVEDTVGADNTDFLRGMISSALDSRPGSIAAGLSSLILFFSASGLVKQLHQSLNIYWAEVLEPHRQPKSERPWHQRLLRALWSEVKIRTKAFVTVLGFGLLLMGTVLLSVALQLAEPYLPQLGFTEIGAYAAANRLLSFLSTVLLFTIIYRFVPKATPSWNHVLPGALIGAAVFALLQNGLTAYFSWAGIGSVYGAAGSLVVLLFWVYYSIQAMFFGAAVVIVQADPPELTA